MWKRYKDWWKKTFNGGYIVEVAVVDRRKWQAPELPQPQVVTIVDATGLAAENEELKKLLAQWHESYQETWKGLTHHHSWCDRRMHIVAKSTAKKLQIPLWDKITIN